MGGSRMPTHLVSRPDIDGVSHAYGDSWRVDPRLETKRLPRPVPVVPLGPAQQNRIKQIRYLHRYIAI